MLVDTLGSMLHAIVHAADIQDRDGGGLLIAMLFGLHPFLTRLYADAGYQGPRFADAVRRAMGQPKVEIVKRSEPHRFVVLPKRWLVERTIAWLNRCRRFAKDWENHSQTHSPSCGSPPSASCSENCAIQHEPSDRLLISVAFKRLMFRVCIRA